MLAILLSKRLVKCTSRPKTPVLTKNNIILGTDLAEKGFYFAETRVSTSKGFLNRIILVSPKGVYDYQTMADIGATDETVIYASKSYLPVQKQNN